ncbi:hypothetical protein C8F04DRAFT_1186483 [Mycena alexandri]|uniref:Uncharacterized protein n=1 Tax=Mycena alexandri TaxID=1745969 RepID=A0AAD6SNI0_9AGAR|nr:hypothetical protein C8F04DRAFT_1186483 [Mycena alexandri]
MPLPLLELSADTIVALEISSRRAQALVAEALQIRADSYDEDMRSLRQVYWDLGHPQDWTPSDQELTWQYARRLAENSISISLTPPPCLLPLTPNAAFYHYVTPRYAKILRARLRRYERLKYLHELEHPLFQHPEFPEHPAATMWREGVSSTTEGLAGWGSQLLSDVPTASHLTEEDDEISPVRTHPPWGWGADTQSDSGRSGSPSDSD